MCGGGVVSYFINLIIYQKLTISYSSDEPSVVRLGDQNLIEFSDGADPFDYGIRTIKIHEGYNGIQSSHDLALIKLMKDVKFTKFIRPACLQQDEDFRSTVLAVSSQIVQLRLINNQFLLDGMGTYL